VTSRLAEVDDCPELDIECARGTYEYYINFRGGYCGKLCAAVDRVIYQ
jgi:hypothetical protein